MGYAARTADSGTAGPDPLTAAFQATDPATGKPYTDDFGWISHTYDTPYLDMGCATQNYIEAELNENTSSIAAPAVEAERAASGWPRATTLTLVRVRGPAGVRAGQPFGLRRPGAGEPGHRRRAGPRLFDAANATGGTLAAGTYEYAVTDQFNGADSPGTDQSSAFVTAPISVSEPAGR